MGKNGSLLLLSMLFVLLVLPTPLILGDSNITIEGTVREHRTGDPIPHANILVLRRYYYRYSRWRSEIMWASVFHGEVDSYGYFNLKVPMWEDYVIYAYYNDSLTPGFDYVPYMKYILRARENYNLTLELWEGASMFLEGEASFVETTETPQSSYSILDPDSGEILQLDEYTPYYGEDSSYNQIPGVSPNHIIVPADTPFIVKVDSKVTVEGETLTHSFLIDRPNHFVLGKGEVIHIDIRDYVLPLSLSTVKAEASEIGLLIEEKEEEGFYLAVERQRFAQITSLILEAENLLSQGAYETCFSRLRYAYTEISNLRNWLNSMYREASISVFLLIFFLAFTATTTSLLLFEERGLKVGGATTFYILFLFALYLLYPGSRLVEASSFLGASLISFVAVLGLSAWVPRVLKGRGVRGRVSLRNMVVPVFSIAKRSLRRRRLRTTLIFLTVMILVSSFIALTSFTTGFGLTFTRVSSQPGPSMGVLVRAPKPLTPPRSSQPYFSEEIRVGAEPWDVLWYPSLDNSSIRWFEERSETLLAAPKMESLPSDEPLGSVGGAPIYGIIDIVPSAEAEFLPWNDTIVEGRYLRDEDENCVLISANLKERLNARVGESLTLWIQRKRLNLRIIGVFDDTRFEGLRDLDGQSPLPWKLTISIIELEHGVIKKQSLTPCSPDETLVVSYRTSSEIDELYLSRLNLMCEAGENLKEYAKMMALNKGFRVWASTEEGVYLAQFASYFQGKGLPLAVPWGIVVLNVVITMLNSLYERRRDLYIYSSIGMNPSHVTATFLAEVAVIGILGGGIGYLVGLGWYKLMSLFTLALQVKQKISALWVLGAIAVAMAAVLVGGYAAIKGSVVLTPSLRRRWKAPFESSSEPLELTLPVTVTEKEVEDLVGYLMKKLRSYRHDVDYVTSGIKVGREELGYCPMCGYKGPIPDRCPRCDYPDIVKEASLRTIDFSYRPASPATSIYSRNKVILREEKGSEVYTVKLLTQGHPKGVQRAASLIRQTIMEWSVERGRKREEDARKEE